MARPIEACNTGPCKAADDPRGCTVGRLSAGYCSRHYTQNKRTGSPYLAIKEPPESVMLAAGLTPLVPYPGNNKGWLCRCNTCHREVTPCRGNVKTRGGACAYCAGRRSDPDECLKIMREARFTPLEPFTDSTTRWKCRCDRCGRQVGLLIGNVRNGTGCAYCQKVRVDPGEAAGVMKAAGFTPLEPYPNASTPWLCRCDTCKRKIRPLYTHVKKGVGCKYCSGCGVVPEEAVAIMEAAGLTPLEPYTNANAPWLCRCENCNQTIRPSYSSVKSGSGCKYCANYGINWDQPTILYLIRNKKLGASKIGIANVHNTDRWYSRLRSHEKHGWVTTGQWVFDRGDTAREVEQTVLHHWRDDLKALPVLSEVDMPQGGWTETASTRKVGLQKTIDYIESQIPQTVVH
jgi:hypothetical protein